MKNLQDRLTAARELKGSRWLTNPDNLEEEQRQRLTELKSQFPRLAQLVDQREALRELFEDRSLTAAGSARLTEWLTAARALGLTALNKISSATPWNVRRTRSRTNLSPAPATAPPKASTTAFAPSSAEPSECSTSATSDYESWTDSDNLNHKNQHEWRRTRKHSRESR